MKRRGWLLLAQTPTHKHPSSPNCLTFSRYSSVRAFASVSNDASQNEGRDTPLPLRESRLIVGFDFLCVRACEDASFR